MRGLTAFTVPAVLFGESIASEGIGENMFVEGRVLTTGGEPIPGAVIDTWETDGTGERHSDVSMSFHLMVNGHMFLIP
jgi:protocatechuate 3,4-dioxygenase beta subunit